MVPTALIDDASSDMLDVVAALDRDIAALSGLRAQAISMTYDWMAETEAARRATGGTTSVAETARRLLVAELAPLLRITANAAAHLVSESRALARQLPATLAALTAGDISYRHATAVVDNAASLPAEAVPQFEARVLTDATRLNVARFADRARRLRERHHPESLRTRRRDALERRSVALEPARDAMAWLSVYDSAEKLVAIDDRLDRLAAAMRSPDDPRTFTQLRADAFSDLLLRGEVPGTLPTGIRPQVLVTVPVLTLLGLHDEPATLEGYGPIPDDVARQLAAEAPSFVRLLTHPETAAVLSVGRDRYTVPADMRLFLRARDEFCRGPGCGRRAATCDVDHGIAWAEGGTTSVDNLAHLCRGDHTRKHTLGWRMRHLAGGTIEWITPFGRRYRTEPANVMRA